MIYTAELFNTFSGNQIHNTTYTRAIAKQKKICLVDSEPPLRYTESDVERFADVRARALTRRYIRRAFLDNYIDIADMLSMEDSMANKQIDRRINVEGKSIRIRANTEQEYAEKVFRVMSGSGYAEAIEAIPQKHDFKEYALHWFNTFSQPNIEISTSKTYERQLRLYWIPAFERKEH